ncbi:hypothetical protein BH11CYA1_BH11CYA1_18470 [soil metagenome]
MPIDKNKDVLRYLDDIPSIRQCVSDLSARFEPTDEVSDELNGEAESSGEGSAFPHIQSSIDYLASPEAKAMAAREPYWPKWDNPWWHALLLEEMGLAGEIPPKFIEDYAATVDKHYLHFFPFTEEEIPVGVSPIFHIACHCYLGSLYRLLTAGDIFDHDLKLADGRVLAGHSATARTIPSDCFDATPEHERALNWVRPWFLKYQITGGGLNCDESNYLKESPSCSVLSTLPALEALVSIDTNLLTEDELAFLDSGVTYLIERNLFRSKRTGEVVDPTWLEPAFPRFYFYDVLRGLTLVTRWALKRSRKLPQEAIAEALHALNEQITREGFVPRRSNVQGRRTIARTESGHEKDLAASSFALLDAVDQVGKPSLHLTQEYLGLLLRLKYMSDARLLR